MEAVSGAIFLCFRRTFHRLTYIHVTKHTYMRSGMVTEEITKEEEYGFLAVACAVPYVFNNACYPYITQDRP